jgi:hypothetical protein
MNVILDTYHYRLILAIMRIVSQALVIASILIIGTGLSQAQLTVAPTSKASQPQNSPKKKTTVLVSLPLSAAIWLRNGNSTRGQIKGFDSKQKILKLGSEIIQLANIDKVIFDSKAPVYGSDGKLVFRGGNKVEVKQQSWQNIPLSSFEFENPDKGLAQVNLSGVLKPIIIKGILSVAVTSKYVVDEIGFPSADKMTLKATPTE